MSGCRTLVTGVAGFTGRHLLARLRAERSAQVFGLDTAVSALPTLDQYCRCDLADAPALARIVSEWQPDVVYHLAGLFGAANEADLERVNVEGFRNLCDALRQSRRDAAAPVRLIAIGSAAELGTRGAAQLPVTEEAPCEPETAYGRSKWAVTRYALALPVDGPLAVVVARPFNLVGPGLGPQLALGRFAAQIRAVLAGQADALHCGNLDARRDYVDVRDAVAAYVALAQRGRPGQLYNVCFGRSHRIGDLLEQLIRLSGAAIPVCPAPQATRPGDLADIYGSTDKLARETGWSPAISIDQSLRELLSV